MTPEEVKKYFGSGYRMWKITGISHSSLSHWLKWGYIPEGSQDKLQRLTKGDLKSDWSEK